VFSFGLPRRWQPLQKLGLALLVAGAVVGGPAARDLPPVDVAAVVLAELPAEAQQTERLIRSGGPFPHAKDGTVFGNRERLLPGQTRGYYREYTVRTPGLSHRGARRIVCGGRQPKQPDACYYTEDHYASFRRIVQ
jgi:ribonuclease T1